MSSTGDYWEMIRRAEENPAAVDFVALRQAYIESDAYEPTAHYSSNKLIGNTNSLSSFEEVITFCRDILQHNPMDLEARMMLHFALEKADHKIEAAQQHAFIHSMLSALFSSGDGKSLETAWKVVAVVEEYTVLSVLGLKMNKQLLLEQDGNWYDKLMCVKRNAPEESPVDVYFEINAPYGYLQETMLGDM